MQRLQERAYMKGFLLNLLIVGLMVLSIGCSADMQSITVAEGESGSTADTARVITVTSAPTPQPTETSEKTKATVPAETAEPMPEAEKVITFGDFRFIAFSGEELPNGYIHVSEEGRPFTLCAFIGTDGTTQWRLYAERDVYEDGVLKEVATGFLPCHVKSAVIRLAGDPSYKIDVAEDAAFVLYEEESFGTATAYIYRENEVKPYADFANIQYGTYDAVEGDTATDEPNYYCLYPAANGIPAPGAVPVEIDEEWSLWYIVPGGDKVLIGKGLPQEPTADAAAEVNSYIAVANGKN